MDMSHLQLTDYLVPVTRCSPRMSINYASYEEWEMYNILQPFKYLEISVLKNDLRHIYAESNHSKE